MPKRASSNDAVDPVRSRLAAAVAGPSPTHSAGTANGTAVGGEPVHDHRAIEPEVGPLTQKPVPRRPAPAIHSRPEPGAFRVNKKFLVTDNESDRIESTLDAISDAFGSRVSYAQASRAMWSVLAIAEEAMAANPRRGEPLRRPSKGDAVGMAEYEAALCDYLRSALKRA